MDYVAHSTAIIDPGARIGKDTRIWHWTHICASAVVGDKCSLGQNVYVGNDVAIGDGVRIQNNVSLYDGVTLEDGVFCGPSAVFTNVINPRAAIPRKHEIRRTLVREGATLGANCTLICGITVGRFAFIAAGAVVAKDVPDYALMVGVPARRTGWIGRHGVKLERARETGSWVCPATGVRYVESAGKLAEAT